MSFFDEDEDEPTTIRPPAPSRPAGRRPERAPRADRPQRSGRPPRAPRADRGSGGDQHDVVRRRRIVAGVAVVAVIVIVLLIAGLVRSGNREALEHYNQSVSTIARESDEQVAAPFFQTLAGARGQQGSNVEPRLNELGQEAEEQARKAGKLSVPGDLTSAQRAFLLSLDLRSEGVRKVANRIAAAIGGGAESATAYKQIAGAMETFLASDVVYTQRVVPLIQEALSSNGVNGQSTFSSPFLPNLGWLEPATVALRTGGHTTASATAGGAPGTQGSALLGVSVGTNELVPPPELNHVHGGPNPTFSVKVENGGSATESNVTVNVSVVAGGKQYSAFHVIESLSAGQSTTVEVPVEGVPLNTGAKVSVEVEPVPGETDVENNKGTFEAIFS